MKAHDSSRRQFFIKGALLAAAVPFVAAGLVGTASAQALKPLPADNATALALKYVADASKTKEPNFKPGSNCANCQFFTAASGACTLFAGYSVAAAGWCTAWAKKA